MHGARAAGHAHCAQRGRALERHEVAHEDLAAPDGAVGAIARAVVDRPDGRALESVLGKARGQVCVVVLDAGQLRTFEIEREGRRRVVGMEVAGDQLGAQREEALEMPDP